jgi:hypothetical protein
MCMSIRKSRVQGLFIDRSQTRHDGDHISYVPLFRSLLTFIYTASEFS